MMTNGITRTENEQRIGLYSEQVPTPGPIFCGNGTLHHLGFVVRSISAMAEEFAVSVSASWDGEVMYDPIQAVRVAFFTPMDARNPVFELVEPADNKSPVSAFLNKGGGLYHVCYEIDHLEEGIRNAQAV